MILNLVLQPAYLYVNVDILVNFNALTAIIFKTVCQGYFICKSLRTNVFTMVFNCVIYQFMLFDQNIDLICYVKAALLSDVLDPVD